MVERASLLTSPGSMGDELAPIVSPSSQHGDEEEHREKAADIVDQLRRGEDLNVILRNLGMCGACRQPCGTGKTLMVVYSDLELDDLMAIAQLWQWKIELEGMEGRPFVIQHANFDLKDHGKIFETKQLAARLMLGALDVHVLTHEGDQGGTRLHDEAAHPQAVQLAQIRDQTIGEICDQLSSFTGDHIDWYVLSPGSGNLAAIVDTLEERGDWPLQAELHVSMYTGSFTMRGMHRADIQALEKMMACAATPLLDINKFSFFGGPHCHALSASIATFAATEEFARNLNPLLAATLKLMNDESNKHMIHPGNKSLFEGQTLDRREQSRFDKMKHCFGQGDSEELAAYAKAILEDRDIFAKVADRKKTAIRAFAFGGCDLPICSPLLFLYVWIRRERPEWLATAQGCWSYNLANGTTCVRFDGKCPIIAIQPSLGQNAAIEQMGQVLEKYFFKHLKEVGEQNSTEVRGNLCYTVPDEDFAKAWEIVSRLHRGQHLSTILHDLGVSGNFEPRGHGKTLAVFYTDLEPDSVMAIAQLWQCKIDHEGMEGRPFIIQHANFDSKDHGMIFEMKQLAARLMLGVLDFHVLTHEGDQGGTRLHDDAVHPKAVQLAATRDSTIETICEQLSRFRGERIDWYIMSPGCGNLAAIVGELERLGAWPLQAQMHISMYSGTFTMRGMHRSDIRALSQMMRQAASPMVNIDKDTFFGDDPHPWTDSLATFATGDFAEHLSQRSPLLASTLKMFNDEFVKHLVHPDNKYLFEKVLHGEERRRFESTIRPRFARGEPLEVRNYAFALLGDEELFDKVADQKKGAIRTFAHGGCDAPLCDQALFLYEWLANERPEAISITRGAWSCDQARGMTSVKVSTCGVPLPEDSVEAISPSLKSPRDETILMEMREALWNNLERRLCAAEGPLVLERSFENSSDRAAAGDVAPWERNTPPR